MDLLDELCSLIVEPDVIDGDITALFGQLESDPTADAALVRGTGDQSDSALQVQAGTLRSAQPRSKPAFPRLMTSKASCFQNESSKS